jgi:hypothetical protein
MPSTNFPAFRLLYLSQCLGLSRSIYIDGHLTLIFPTLGVEALESMCSEERKSCGLHMSRRGMGTEPGYLSSDLSS